MSEQGPLCSDLFFCLWLQNTPSAIPFLLLSARTHAQFTRSVSSALATVSLSLPTFRGFESISKLFANIFLVTSLQNDTEPIASGLNTGFYSYGNPELRHRFATSLQSKTLTHNLIRGFYFTKVLVPASNWNLFYYLFTRHCDLSYCSWLFF